MGRHKLLIPLADGRALIEHAVDSVVAAGIDPVVVVLGHDGPDVRAALGRRPLIFVQNPHFAQGLSTSLHAGILALPAETAGFFICLGDMPCVQPQLLRRMADAFVSNKIIVPVWRGRRGNPVLWSRRFLPELLATRGDTGGARLIERHADAVVEIVADDDGVAIDLDTPAALARFAVRRGRSDLSIS